MTDPANNWYIRNATPDDLPAVLQLHDEAVAWLNAQGITEQWGTTPVSTRPHLVEEISGFLGFGAVAEGDGICGFIAMSGAVPDDFDSCADRAPAAAGNYIHTLVAGRQPVARGAGAHLVHWAAQQARSQGRAYLFLSCWAGNPKLVAYYQRLGFVRCGMADAQRWKGRLWLDCVDW